MCIEMCQIAEALPLYLKISSSDKAVRHIKRNIQLITESRSLSADSQMRMLR